MQVKEIMRKAVTTIPSTPIRKAAHIMAENDIGSLIVVQKPRLVGILTERDLIKYFSKLCKPNAPVGNIMSRNVKIIQASADINEAAGIMTKNKIKRLPVVDGKRLVGIVTATDLIAHSDEFDEPFFF